jgi:hypothetical protein
MGEVAKALGDAYAEPAKDAEGYIAYVKGQKGRLLETSPGQVTRPIITLNTHSIRSDNVPRRLCAEPGRQPEWPVPYPVRAGRRFTECRNPAERAPPARLESWDPRRSLLSLCKSCPPGKVNMG